jgi:formamidopyrimidine-DNA glycosylase
MEGDLFLVIHLMVAGRFHLKEKAKKPAGKVGLAAFDFPAETMMVTEASTKKRASLHVVAGRASLAAFHRGGIEVLETSAEAFREALRRERHTLKRTLTDPRLLSGIGNAYSDEILHRAGLSPVTMSTSLDDEAVDHLRSSCQAILREWTDRLRTQTGDDFPEKVTAFRPEMAVHGRYRQPCPVCGTAVQRIVYADNETNYCPRCQTGGKLLADRSLSRLLKSDWPRSIDELEERTSGRAT